MDLLTEKKLTDKLFSVLNEFGLHPSHIQNNLNQEDHSKRFIMIFFSGIQFEESDFKNAGEDRP